MYAIDDSEGKLFAKLRRAVSKVGRLPDTPANRKKAERIKYRLERQQQDYYVLLTTYNFTPLTSTILTSVRPRVITRGDAYLIHSYYDAWEPHGAPPSRRTVRITELQKQRNDEVWEYLSRPGNSMGLTSWSRETRADLL